VENKKQAKTKQELKQEQRFEWLLKSADNMVVGGRTRRWFEIKIRKEILGGKASDLMKREDPLPLPL